MNDADGPTVANPARLTAQFEILTRQLRWLSIATVAFLFPYGPAYQPYAFVLIAVATMYNLLRYYQPFLRLRWFSSPLFVIVADNVFLGTLIWLLGNVNTPFTGFLIFLVISATYRYRLPGGLLIGFSQIAWLLIVNATHMFPPVVLNQQTVLLVTAAVLFGIGLQVDRLTNVDQKERAMLKDANSKTDSERSHLVALVNTLTDVIFVVNGQGKIVLYNDAAATLTGVAESLRGKLLVDCMPLYARSDIDAKQVDLLADRTSPQRRRDLCFEAPDGQVTDLDISIRAVQLESLETTDYIVVCQDITRARSLDEQRSEFISVASHELRTPIAIMEAALSTALLSKEIPAATRPLLEQAHGNSVLLAGIIKDLSTLAKAKNDNIPIKIERLDSRILLPQLTDGFKAQAAQRNQNLILNIDEQTPIVLTTERHVREILHNYLTNAIKYTPDKGEIRLSSQPAKNGGVLFCVSDNGIGIAPTDQKHLFTKFFRVEDYRTRTTGGTGLGLYLCRELAERIGAKVWCESTLDQGSAFYLQIPPFSGQSHEAGKSA